MRGTVAGLGDARTRWGRRCPALYQDDDVRPAASSTALDTVLAPVLATLDNLDAYLDP